MTDSIREQILTNFETRLATIRTANQYNSEMGQTVTRSFLPAIDGSLVPAVGFHLGDEENLDLYSDHERRELPIRVQGVAAFGSTRPEKMAELLYADIAECILGIEWSLGFDSGGTHEPTAGDAVLGETSAATAIFISDTLDSGTYAGGDADGTLSLRRVVGDFQDDEELTIGGNAGAATVDGLVSGTGPLTLTTGDLAEAITFSVGNIQPNTHDGTVVGAQIVFRIQYKSISGNPYSQTI